MRPLLALLLTDRLSMSRGKAGLYVSLVSLMFLPGSLIGGKLADHLGRKRVLSVAWLLGLLSLIPCAFLGASPWVAWLLILNALFFGITDPCLSAMVADLTNPGNRARVYALLYLGNNIGFALGPMLAGLLYRHYLPMVFLGDAATGLLALLLIIVYIRETMPGSASLEADGSLPAAEAPVGGGAVRVLLLRPVMILFALVTAVLTFAYVQHAFSLPLQMQEIFGETGPQLFGVLMSVNALTVVGLTTLIAKYASRIPPLFNVGLGGVFFAFGFGLILLVKTMPWLIVSTVIWTIGEILVFTNERVFIANNTPSSHRGRLNALVDIVGGAGFALGPVIMGGTGRPGRAAGCLGSHLPARHGRSDDDGSVGPLATTEVSPGGISRGSGRTRGRLIPLHQKEAPPWPVPPGPRTGSPANPALTCFSTP